MGIKDEFRHQSDTVLGSPQGAELYSLTAMKVQLKLEKEGVMKPSSNWRKKYAKKLGLSPTDSYDNFLAAADSAIKEGKKAVLRTNLILDRVSDTLMIVRSCDRTAHISRLDENSWRVSFDTNNAASGTREVELIDSEEVALHEAKYWVLEVR